MGLFSYDSPFMSFLWKATEFVIICLLGLLFSLPIITAGAAITAKYYVGMKLVRGEDVPCFKGFFRSFRQNFKQATIIWIIELLVGAFLTYDWYLIAVVGGDKFNMTLKILLAIITAFVVMAGMAVFALIARFEMSTKEAIKGAFAYAYINVPRMLLIIFLTVLPGIASYKYAQWLVGVWPIGSAMCLYLICYQYIVSFRKLEENLLGTSSSVDESGEGINRVEGVEPGAESGNATDTEK